MQLTFYNNYNTRKGNYSEAHCSKFQILSITKKIFNYKYNMEIFLSNFIQHSYPRRIIDGDVIGSLDHS